MGEVEVYAFGSSSIRVVDGNTGVWFVATDIAVILGYRSAADAIRMLAEDEKSKRPVRTPGGVQSLSVVSESGLYSLIMRSQRVEAGPFQRWVTREVLPAIRKTGAYGAPILPVPTLGEALEGWLGTVRELEAAQARLAVEAPKVEAFDQLMRSENTSTFEDVAKAVNLGRNTLVKLLREWKVLQPAPSRLPYQTHAHLFDVSYGTHVERGRVVSHVGVRVLPAGVAFIARKVANQSVGVELTQRRLPHTGHGELPR